MLEAVPRICLPAKHQPTLPTEILLHIFSLTYRRAGAWDLAPNGQLPRFARVCRAWLPAARMALYSVVYLGRDGDAHGPTLDWTCGALKRTLRAHPALGALIVEVHYSHSEAGAPAAATSDAAKVLRMCPLVRRVVLRGWSNYRLAHLRRALAGLRALEHLVLSPYPLSGARCDPFCHLPDLFRLLPCWPDLRSLVVDRDGLGWDPESPSVFGEDADALSPAERDALRLTCAFPTPAGACARLAHVAILASVGDRHLAALARMAPRLRALALPQAGGLSRLALRPALAAWAGSLEALHLNVADDSDFVFGVSVPGDDGAARWALDDALAGLPRLSELTTRTAVVRAAAFRDKACWPALERLALAGAAREDLGALRAAVECALPRLQALEVVPEDGWALDGACELEAACARRGICLANGLAGGAWARFNDICARRGFAAEGGFGDLGGAVDYKAWRDRDPEHGEGVPWLDESFVDSDVDDF